MTDRLLEIMSKLWKWAVLVLPAIVAILCMPVAALVHESHGFVGLFFGMLTCFSAWITNKVIWICTGRNWIDEIL